MSENYGNIKTGEVVETLPQAPFPLTGPVGPIWTPTATEVWAYHRKMGWRKVTMKAKPTDGYRVTKWRPLEIDDETCQLAVLEQVSIAAEAQAKAEADALLAAQQAEAARAGTEELAKELGDSLTVKVLCAVLSAEGVRITVEDCVAEARKQLGL